MRSTPMTFTVPARRILLAVPTSIVEGDFTLGKATVLCGDVQATQTHAIFHGVLFPAT